MPAFSQITDDAFPGAIALDFHGQRILYVEPFGRWWGWSDLADGSSWNSLEIAQAETSPDRIKGLIVSHNEALIFGERTIEPWALSPTDTAVYQLQTGAVIESGCASGKTIQRLDNGVFYLDNNGRIVRLNGYTPQVISTVAIEANIRDCNWSRAFAFTYEDSGHAIYYITFPDGYTWGYDVRQGRWHRRESYGMDRWRINALVKSNGKWVAGDYANGRIYELEHGNVYEGCEIMPRKIGTGVLHNLTNRVQVHGLKIVAATGLPPKLPPTIEAEPLEGYRWLGTGQIESGPVASVRPLGVDMVWTGDDDSSVSPTFEIEIKGAANFGGKMVAVLDNGECKVAEVDSITSWSDGPEDLSFGGIGAISVFGDRLYVACGAEGIAYLDDLDSPFVTLTNMLSLIAEFKRSVQGVTGFEDNVLCMDAYGAFYSSSDRGANWTAGADLLGTGNRFYTSYGALDSNGTRAVVAGGETGLRAAYTDDNGATFTDCTLPAVSGSVGNHVRYCGDDRWLIACRGNATASDGLFKSTDNGETFTAVTLPEAVEFLLQYKQNIGVDPETGRVVIAGQQIGSATRRYYYSDDLSTWTEISTADTGVSGIVEVYTDLPDPPADVCTPMDSGVFQMRYAKDGAANYSNWRDFEAPRTGHFLQPLIVRRLGMARHWALEILDTSNVPQDVMALAIHTDTE